MEQSKALAESIGEVAGRQAFLDHLVTTDLPVEVVQDDAENGWKFTAIEI